MTDKPELSWHPTTIEELQRLLDSGVWPRIRAIADDVGPLQIAQGRLTYIGIEKDGMSGILREGPAPAGAEPFDLTSRSLWLWRAEASDKMARERDVESEVERLADYLLRNHASACTGPGEGVSAVDVAIGLLAQAGEERRRLLEAQKADRARCDGALRRIADASRLTVLGQRAPEYAMELAERVEKQFADFRKVADRLGTDREIAGAAEQLVRRLVDRLVETDPEYIEQLRRGGS